MLPTEKARLRCLEQLLVHCTRPADHVLDGMSTLQGSPDPLEVYYVRVPCCTDPSPTLSRRHPTNLDGSTRTLPQLRIDPRTVLRRRGRLPGLVPRAPGC